MCMLCKYTKLWRSFKTVVLVLDGDDGYESSEYNPLFQACVLKYVILHLS